MHISAITIHNEIVSTELDRCDFRKSTGTNSLYFKEALSAANWHFFENLVLELELLKHSIVSQEVIVVHWQY